MTWELFAKGIGAIVLITAVSVITAAGMILIGRLILSDDVYLLSGRYARQAAACHGPYQLPQPKAVVEDMGRGEP